jgi:ribosomal protein S17E
MYLKYNQNITKIFSKYLQKFKGDYDANKRLIKNSLFLLHKW